MIQDLRFGVRQLWQAPGFTTVAVLTLALGIGANTAIFSVVNALLLRPLPFREPDRLMFMGEYSEQVKNMSVSWPNYIDFRDRNQVFEQLAAFRGATMNMTGSGDPERLSGSQCTHNLFVTFGVQPALGRAFTPEEDKPGGERVIVLSHRLWTRRFGSDPQIAGKVLTLNGNPWTVVGVMPPQFLWPSRTAEFWISLGRDADQMQNRGSHPGIYTVARLKPGVSPEQSKTEMIAVAKRLAEEYPQSNTGNSVNIVTLNDRVMGDLRTPLRVLIAAVVLVLLIACANVANLQLARGAARMKEISVRSALGAGKLRLIRQLLTESTMLAVIGGALGVALATWGVKGLVAATPANVPRVQDVVVDGEVLLFTLAVALLTGILFGFAPALLLARGNLNETLKEGGRGSGAGRTHHRLRSSLVVAEVTLSLLLLVGAGLVLRSFFRLVSTSWGFNTERVLTMQLTLPQGQYPDDTARRNFHRQLMERIETLPGIEAAGGTAPLLGGWQNGFCVEGQPAPPPGQTPSTDVTRVSPVYFKAMGVPLLRGRYFTAADNEATLRVAIIDDTFAKKYWPNDDPLGKRIRWGCGGGPNPPQWMTIVGVVGHVKNYGVDQESRVETYVPFVQQPLGFTILVLRTPGDPASLTAAVREQIRGIDANLPIYGIRTMERIVADATAPRRLAALLLGVFAAIALALAAVGIYGVMSYSVSQRTHEIGIRMALGAGGGSVASLVIRQGMTLVVAGLALGLAGALALTRLIQTMLFGISPTDSVTFAAVPISLLLVALGASYLPARRATQVDPLVALRHE